HRFSQLHDKTYRHGSKPSERVGALSFLAEDAPGNKHTLPRRVSRPRPVPSILRTHRALVRTHHLRRLSVFCDYSIADPHHSVTEAANLIELVGDENDGAAGASNVAHLAEAFFLEVYITDSKDFI